MPYRLAADALLILHLGFVLFGLLGGLLVLWKRGILLLQLPTAAWANLDTGASGSSDITAVSTIDGHYGFIGYANTTFETGSGTVVVTLSSHPGAELRITA